MDIPNVWRKHGTLAVDIEVRRILRAAIKAAKTPSKKKQNDIALVMSKELGHTVKPHMLADFTRNGTKRRQLRFPIYLTRAFCHATGDETLQLYVLDLEQRSALELGRRHAEFGWLFGKLRNDLQKLLRGQPRAGRGKRARR